MTDTKICPKCGRKLHKDARFCMYCMASLAPKNDITPAQLHNRSRWWIWVLLGVLSVCIFLTAFWFVTYKIVKDPSYDIVGSTGSETSDSMETTEQGALNPEGTTGGEDQSPVTTPSDIIVPDYESGGTLPVVTDPFVPTQPTSPTQTPSKPEIPEETQGNTEASGTIEPTEPTDPPCNHRFAEATCVSPMTCIYCTDTIGTVDFDAHNWVAETATVHHKEVGHYEDVERQVKKIKYMCFFCGYNHAGYDTLEEVRLHMQTHSHQSMYDWAMSHPTYRAEEKEVWETVIMQEWVVDAKAYDETVIIGYNCSACGETKTE